MMERMRVRSARAVAGVMAGVLVLATTTIARAQGSGGDEQSVQAVAPAPAPDPAKETTGFLETIEVGGFVDLYYLYGANGVDPQLRNFDVDHNTFSLNYAEIAINRAPTVKSRFGFRFDIGAGDTAELVNAFEPSRGDALEYIQQAYVSVLAPLGKEVTIDFGKFVTPAGGEVIENKDNFNYSRGLLFSLAIPYYHAGVRAAVPLTDKVTVTGFLMNGWNNVEDNNDAKTVGASLAFKPTDKVALYTNYLVGNEWSEEVDGGVRNLVDVVLSVSPTEKLTLLGNFDYGRDELEGESLDWVGWAGSFKYQATERFAFAPRFEWLTDSSRFVTGGTDRVSSVTLTGEYKAFGGFIARAEYRTDFASDPFFVNDDDTLKENQTTFSIGLIYAFTAR